MVKNISVPDIGDFKDVEIIEVLVKPGDQVKKNDGATKPYAQRWFFPRRRDHISFYQAS